MAKFSYDVTIPGSGSFEVNSDTELTDQQAYDYALQSMPPRTTADELVRSLGITARGVAPVAAGAAIGAPFGPVGILAGTIALPAAELATQAANVALPQQYQIPSPAGAVENLMTRIGLPKAETTAERMAQSAAGALSSVGGQIATLPTLARTATTDLGRRIAEMLSQAPGRQIVAAAPAAAVAQGVGEEFGPLAGAGAGMATGAAFGIGARPRVGPTAEELAAKSTQLFEKARESGVMFNAPKFADKMTGVMNNLRDEGYEYGSAYPKLDIAFKRLTDPNTPKDFTGLTNLRKTIQTAQASSDPSERRLATILKDQFDEYVSSAPTSDILGANTKTGTELWKQARGEYSKLMKADVFETMLENAQLDVSKFTASGAENSMAQQLRQLAKNDKKMRLFTKAEQAEITAAAKGTSAQNLLKFFGRFAPTGPVTAYGAGVATGNNILTIPLMVAATAARGGATAMRRQSIERLADMMRLGAPVPKQIPVPAITGGRGLISPQVPLDVTSEQLQQIYGQ